jgi:hypothetical protein
MLYLDNDECFAQGACAFSRTISTQQGELDRITLLVQVDDITTEAAIDTGGAYLFCNPQLAETLNLDESDALTVNALEIRGQTLRGTLHRVFLNLLADRGETIQLDVTAFVPRPGPHVEVDVPVYLGFRYCLENCRFAVDPVTDTFYFGN